MSRIISRVGTNFTAKKAPFPYQAQAFSALKDLDYSAIFHEQGLGKTKIAVDLLLYWLEYRDIDTVLIVTKKQLIKNWIDELIVHTHITPKTLSSNKVDNFYVLNSASKIILANFETLSTDKDRIKLFLQCRNVAIIIDESAKIKNPETKLTKDFIELADLFKIRTIMTGTPVANRPYDIWSQIYFLDKGKSLGEDFQSFKNMTNLSNKLAENNSARETFESNISSIYEKISTFSVRETKKTSGVILPQKEYKTIFSEFEDTQLSMYNKVIEDLKIEIMRKGKSIIDDDTIILKRLLRLLQIASNPCLIDSSYSKKSGKECTLDYLLAQIMQMEDKCIVWSNFIENIDLFCARYKKYGACKIHGSMSMKDRDQSVHNFKNKTSYKVLFATPQAAKEGLTLTVANHVIFYDRGFNLDDYLQAQDRIHRISQTKICYIYNIMMNKSIDIWIDKLLEAKHYAALLSQGDISLTEYSRHIDYSYGDIIQEILTPRIY